MTSSIKRYSAYGTEKVTLSGASPLKGLQWYARRIQDKVTPPPLCVALMSLSQGNFVLFCFILLCADDCFCVTSLSMMTSLSLSLSLMTSLMTVTVTGDVTVTEGRRTKTTRTSKWQR